jgi:hypothetical protein
MMKWWQKIWNWHCFWIEKNELLRASPGLEITDVEVRQPIDVYLTINKGPEKLIGRFKSQDEAEWEAQAHVARIVMSTGDAASASVRYQSVLPQSKASSR